VKTGRGVGFPSGPLQVSFIRPRLDLRSQPSIAKTPATPNELKHLSPASTSEAAHCHHCALQSRTFARENRVRWRLLPDTDGYQNWVSWPIPKRQKIRNRCNKRFTMNSMPTSESGLGVGHWCRVFFRTANCKGNRSASLIDRQKGGSA
jgi:hypothetical protein